VDVEVITGTMRRLKKVGGLRRPGTIRPKAMFGKTLREGGSPNEHLPRRALPISEEDWPLP
jgi:hypothetical protein